MKKGIKLLSIALVMLLVTVLLGDLTAQKQNEHITVQKEAMKAFQDGDYPKAVALFTKALEYGNKLAVNDANKKFMYYTYSNLGLSLKRLNYFQDALAIYGELIEYAPYASSVWYFNTAEAYKEMAKFYNDYKGFNEAIKTLKLLAKRKDKIADYAFFSPYLYSDFGELYMLKADYKSKDNKSYKPKSDLSRSSKYAKKAIKLLKKKKRDKNLNNLLARNYFNRGLIYYRFYTGKAMKNDKAYMAKLEKDIQKNKDKYLKYSIKYLKYAIKYKNDFPEAHEAVKRLSPLAIKELEQEKEEIKQEAKTMLVKLKTEAKLSQTNMVSTAQDELVTQTSTKPKISNVSPAQERTEEYSETPEAKIIKMAMLEQLNKDRARHNLKPVSIDVTCTKVGDAHNKESQKYKFIGHQLTDGYNPYYHYSQAGGNDYHSQNAAARWGYSSKQKDINTYIDWVLDSQYRMYSEVPPNDGHRRCMLDPNRTHVGIGLAYSPEDCFVTQEFVNKYAEVEDMPRKASLSDTVYLKGKPLSSDHRICGATIFYEPFAKGLTPEEINNIWHYGLPKDRKNLYPQIEGGYKYSDGSTGDIVVNSDGSFKFPVKFYKNKPGVYTAVAWFVSKKDKRSPSFPVTSISVKAN